MIPTTEMWEQLDGAGSSSNRRLNPENTFTLCFLLALQFITYFSVQGSDPGYLDAGSRYIV
ncbi:unnamed protein product [Heterosigma akashiwo]